MALPDQAVLEDQMYRAQRFMAVRGHAKECGLPEEDFEAYEFNIKIDLKDVVYTKNPTDAQVDKVVKAFLKKSCDEAKSIWPWIKNIHQVGRSGGWVVIEIEPPGFKEWIPEYHNETLDTDHRNLIWMVIRNRVEDLEAIQEFIADQQKTLKQQLPSLIK